jgi:hypothetical protein
MSLIADFIEHCIVNVKGHVGRMSFDRSPKMRKYQPTGRSLKKKWKLTWAQY